MNCTALRRVAVPSLAALALGFAATACGAANESISSSSSSALTGTVSGAGSSAQKAAMTAWRASFQTANPNVTVNYDPAGSGAGVTGFNTGKTAFAASDAALDPKKSEVAAATKRCGGDYVEVPSYVSPIAIVFKLDGVTKLNLSADVIAKIFNGTITKWDDPAIAALNSGVKLPSSSITPVHRSDESGTTKNFTDYLEKAAGNAWKFKADKVWPLKTGEGANGTTGVIAAISNGSIGYVDESAARNLTTASIKVGSDFVAPTADGAGKALGVSPIDTSRNSTDLAIKVDRTTTEAGAYPLFLVSYVIACKSYADKNTADLVKGFLGLVIGVEGQQAAAKQAGSAPLPTTLQTKAISIINQISAK